MDPKKTGMIILDARKKLCMTQKELADKLYVSDKAVSKWERGLCFPDISVLIPLTEILNIGLYELLKGESVNKKEIEETLKDTINYSNDELKRKEKKYIIVSSIVITIIIFLCIMLLVLKNNDIGGIVDRDTIYDISYYSDYKTSIGSSDSEKLELIVMRLPLSWKERTFEIENNIIKINYGVSYKDVVKAYNDENYVKLAMINIASVIFTTVYDVDSLEIKYSDFRYSIKKEKLKEVYNISNFDEVIEKEDWEKLISKKLVSDKFIDDTFKLFEKNKVSKK